MVHCKLRSLGAGRAGRGGKTHRPWLPPRLLPALLLSRRDAAAAGVTPRNPLLCFMGPRRCQPRRFRKRRRASLLTAGRGGGCGCVSARSVSLAAALAGPSPRGAGAPCARPAQTLVPRGRSRPPGWSGHRSAAAAASRVLLSFGRGNGSGRGFVQVSCRSVGSFWLRRGCFASQCLITKPPLTHCDINLCILVKILQRHTGVIECATLSLISNYIS